MREIRGRIQMQPTIGRPMSPNHRRYPAIYQVNGGACDDQGVWVQYPDMYDPNIRQQACEFGQLRLPTVWIANKAKFETLLESNDLIQKAIDNLVDLASTREHDAPWDGVDFDIETIDNKYKDRMTLFYTKGIEALHNNGMYVNLTATASDRDFGLFGTRHAFDFEVLGQIADSITVMLYTSFGMHPNDAPGPYEQSERVLTYVLSKNVPPEKLYAGLSIASRYINRDTHISYYLCYEKANFIMREAGVRARWYETGDDGRRFAMKRASWSNHDMWIMDRQVMRIHVGLADQFNIAGISLFVPGSEDPSIWPMLARWQYPYSNGVRTRRSRCYYFRV